MFDTSRISVILPCRNEAAHIERCLRSVATQHTNGGVFEVLVADGMSTDGTREILGRVAAEVRSQRSEVGDQRSEVGDQRSEVGGQESEISGPRIRIIDNPGRIASTGLNAAIRAATGDIIVRFDAHTEYAPDYIQRCAEVLTETGADNVGGPARTKADTLLQKAVAAAYHSPFSVGGARFHNPDYEGYVDTVTYGCWRREAFEKFGYFDEELVRNQDDEHNLRIIRGGGRVYQSPKIRSWYRPRSSLPALFKQYMQYGYWKVRVIQKHKLPASWRHLVPGTFVLSVGLLASLSAAGYLLSALVPSSWSYGPMVLWSSALLLALLSSYLLALCAASLITAAKSNWKLLPLLPLVFPCYHFGYGIGFLRGIVDFAILKRVGSKRFKVLTR